MSSRALAHLKKQREQITKDLVNMAAEANNIDEDLWDDRDFCSSYAYNEGYEAGLNLAILLLEKQ